MNEIKIEKGIVLRYEKIGDLAIVYGGNVLTQRQRHKALRVIASEVCELTENDLTIEIMDDAMLFMPHESDTVWIDYNGFTAHARNITEEQSVTLEDWMASAVNCAYIIKTYNPFNDTYKYEGYDEGYDEGYNEY